jgi:hypothetical protein
VASNPFHQALKKMEQNGTKMGVGVKWNNDRQPHCIHHFGTVVPFVRSHFRSLFRCSGFSPSLQA